MPHDDSLIPLYLLLEPFEGCQRHYPRVITTTLDATRLGLLASASTHLIPHDGLFNAEATVADSRPTLTLKSDAFTPEFRALLNKAARKRKMTQAAYVAEVLAEASRRTLQGNPDDTPVSNPPPAVIEDLTARQEKTAAQLVETNAAITTLANQVKALTDAQRRGFWSRFINR